MRLLALALVLSACGRSSAPPSAPRRAGATSELLPSRVVVTEPRDTWGSMASDGTTLYFQVDDVLRAVPVAGGESRTVKVDGTPIVEVEADGAEVFLLQQTRLSRLGAGDALEEVATLTDATRMAIGPTVIVVEDSGSLHAVPRPGRDGARGSTRVIVENAGLDPFAHMAADATHVYWTFPGVEPRDPREYGSGSVITVTEKDGTRRQIKRPPPEPKLGAIWRAPLGGGAAEVFAADQLYPVGLAIAGDHVYWSNGEGEAVMRAAKRDGRPRVTLRGRGAALAGDARGIAVYTASQLLAEVPVGGGSPQVRSLATQRVFDLLALDEHGLYALDVGGRAIVRFPRDDDRVTILATPRGKLGELVLDGDDVIYLDLHLAADRQDRVMRVPRRGGKPREVFAAYGALELVAAGGGHVFASGQLGAAGEDPDHAGILRDGRELATREEIVDVRGMVADGEALYLNEIAFFRIPHGTDAAELLFRPEYGMGQSGPQPVTRMWVDATHLYAAGFFANGFVRVPKRGKDLEQLAADVDEGAPLRDGVVLFKHGQGLSLYPDGRKLAEVEDLTSLAGDDGAAWLVARAGDEYGLLRVSAADGKVETIVRGVGSESRLAVDDEAVYVAARAHDALLRIEK
jgi:hypothetical protein